MLSDSSVSDNRINPLIQKVVHAFEPLISNQPDGRATGAADASGRGGGRFPASRLPEFPSQRGFFACRDFFCVEPKNTLLEGRGGKR